MTLQLIKQPALPADLPYKGPGFETLQGPTLPGQDVLSDQIRDLAKTPAGTAVAVTQLHATRAGTVGLLNVGYPSGYYGAQLAYSPLITNNSYSFFSFDDPVSFPLASTATAAPQTLPATTALADLVTYTYGSQTNGSLLGSLFPNTATSATATPLQYGLTADGNSVGIIFTDTNATGVAEAINLRPTGNVQSIGAGASDTQCLWGIVIETPAALTAGDGSLFCIGATMATQQIAFVVVGGKFGVYINGGHFLSSGVTALVSTKYALGASLRPDPKNPGHFEVVLYTSKQGDATYAKASFPYPANVTPWTYTGTRTRTIQPGDGIEGFGPQPAYGGQWAFKAVSCFVENPNAITSFPVDPADRFQAYRDTANIVNVA